MNIYLPPDKTENKQGFWIYICLALFLMLVGFALLYLKYNENEKAEKQTLFSAVYRQEEQRTSGTDVEGQIRGVINKILYYIKQWGQSVGVT